MTDEFAQFKESFRIEAEERLAEIEEGILDLEDNHDDRDAVDRLFRAMHTIKGSGAMFGFEDISSFAHHVEAVLDRVRAGDVEVTRELIDLVLSSKDAIKAMLGVKGVESATTASERRVIVEELWKFMPNKEGAPGARPVQIAEEPADVTDIARKNYRVRFIPPRDIYRTGTDPASLLDELKAMGEMIVTPLTDGIPPLSEIDPELCYFGWDCVLTTIQTVDAIKDVFIFVEDGSSIKIEELSNDRPNEIGEILVQRGDAKISDVEMAALQQKKIGEILVDHCEVSREKINSALSEQKVIVKQKDQVESSSIRVPSDRLDRLINIVGELVITQARLTQIASHMDNRDLTISAEGVELLTAELRDIALGIRMMPIGTSTAKFRRVVRDLSTELGKKVGFVVEGAETELDKTVLDRLGDVLVHMIRNSIDHGIESPDEREAVNKPASGTLKLTAEHKGAHVVISVEDDGRGLDPESIRAKGIERGLITKDAELSNKEIFALIFKAGFSMAKKVTSVSGRGVGMDVVKREIEALRGSVDISSVKGVGTKIDLSLPLTLAIIDGMLVVVGENRYVIPLSLVEECVEITDGTIEKFHGRHVIEVRGEIVPYVRLREIFGFGESELQSEAAVVVHDGDRRVGVVVDAVVGNHQTVIKSLGSMYKDIEVLSGATILGDGSVAMILDVGALIAIAEKEELRSCCGKDTGEGLGENRRIR